MTPKRNSMIAICTTCITKKDKTMKTSNELVELGKAAERWAFRAVGLFYLGLGIILALVAYIIYLKLT